MSTLTLFCRWICEDTDRIRANHHFEAFYAQVSGSVFAFLRLKLADRPARAEELLQETFIRFVTRVQTTAPTARDALRKQTSHEPVTSLSQVEVRSVQPLVGSGKRECNAQ